MESMRDKVAVITGGTQGLGAAIALEMAREAASGLVICGRDRDKGQAQAARIRTATGCDVTFVAADLGDVAACRHIIAATDERYGRVDCLVNSAALTDRGSILDTSPDLFDRIFAVNVRAPFFLMQDAIRLMKRDDRRGTIVNVCSMSAVAGQSFLAAYSASKGALATLTRNVAFSVMRNRIRVNAISPGWMASDGEDQIMRRFHGATDGWQERAGQALPFGRLLSPEDVARAVVFLAGEQSGLMTGSVVDYDQSVHGGYDVAPVPSEKL
ncbi:dehydrogenase [Ameyamaea chiangmaiensis NBRC 103196]|uniref:SDR family oxidoreductase n=1 Tax=Ameyamaea chiangmaiensis TaxID=442969 RepID=A0A850P3F1_9PROT|nr:SDR family oxidoreductase [Ameyamaea chiangmaiensis]MBS4073809.1 SDR family oxidoreductase [Ameyamaea chiangmaiensis]NVN39195.1 SDR family oxidoreductase [Ameyamaea chiangmaiensis]GBQ68349.1 dehydrogenase [Ameyamaea chiangmaiensis NBRC 103196]